MLKNITGTIIAKNSLKTVKVKVDSSMQHPVYKKTLRRSKTYVVHTDIDVAIGDTVSIVSTRPISKTKRFKVLEITTLKPKN